MTIRIGSITGLLLTAGLVTACQRDTTPPQALAPLPTEADSLAGRSGATAADGVGGVAEYLPVVVRSAAADSIARQPLTLTLADLGHRDGLTMLGSSDVISLTLPVNDGLLPEALTLELLPTPGMPTAAIVVSQRQRILAQERVTDTTSRLVIPLSDVVVEHGQVTLSLGLTVPGQDVCLSSLYYRTVVQPHSRVSYRGTPAFNGQINDFFQPWVRQVVFYLPDQPSLDAAQAALDAAAYTARRWRGMTTTFAVRPLPPVGAALPEPGPWDRALVWSPEGETHVVRPDSGRGTVMAIAARRDARQLFTLPDGELLVAANAFRAGSVDLTAHFPGAAQAARSFGELGFGARTISGNALIMTSYPFALADLGAASTPTSLRLVAEHSGVPTDGNGTLRIHLNGSLIHSRPLDRRSIDQVITLPRHLLTRDNLLEVRFQVVLGEGSCRLGGPVFTATIDPQSAFLVDDGAVGTPGFDRFPSSLLPSFSVLLEPRDRYRVELATTLVGALQTTTSTPLAPALARDRAEATGPLVAVGGAGLADHLNAPVHSEAFRLRDRDGKVWDEFTPGTPYATMQGWYAQGRDVLLLHHTQANGQPLADLLHEALTPYGWFGVRGDLAVRGEAGRTHLLHAANAGWLVENEGTVGRTLVDRYRSAVFVVAALVLFGLLIWLYPRVVRRELDPTG